MTKKLTIVLLAIASASASLAQKTKTKSLFDGKTLTGWHFFKGKENNSWEVKDGVLHCKPFDGAEKRADLITDEQFENFELTIEWKISPQGNSGIIYRATEEFNEPYLSGPEYQVLDDVGYPGKIEDWQKTASNYGMYVSAVAPKSVGEWNLTKIIVNGNKVEHWLNGKKAVSYEFGSEDWNKKKAASKWNEAKGYGKAKEGGIDLQDHGGEVWYKNISIKTL
jgi:hypothetical protein